MALSHKLLKSMDNELVELINTVENIKIRGRIINQLSYQKINTLEQFGKLNYDENGRIAGVGGLGAEILAELVSKVSGSPVFKLEGFPSYEVFYRFTPDLAAQISTITNSKFRKRFIEKLIKLDVYTEEVLLTLLPENKIPEFAKSDWEYILQFQKDIRLKLSLPEPASTIELKQHVKRTKAELVDIFERSLNGTSNSQLAKEIGLSRTRVAQLLEKAARIVYFNLRLMGEIKPQHGEEIDFWRRGIALFRAVEYGNQNEVQRERLVNPEMYALTKLNLSLLVMNPSSSKGCE